MLTYPTLKLLEFGLFPTSKMMDSMTSIGASKFMVSWHVPLETERSSVLDYIHLHPLLHSRLCSVLVEIESWPLWTVSPVISRLPPPSGTWPLGDVSGDQCRREVRMFLLASVLLPTVVLAIPTPFCLQLLPGSLSFMSLAPNGTQYSFLPPLPLQAQGWLTSPSWLV